MSIAHHHSEWLSLIEVSGPFLSMPVLMRAFPQGLVAHNPEKFRTLKLAFEEWQANSEAGPRTNPAIHGAWIRFILTNVLELPAESILERQAIPQALAVTPPGDFADTVRPSLVLNDPATSKPRLLIQTYPRNQNLDKSVSGRSLDSPASRMEILLKGTGVKLGVVTNGEQWMLVNIVTGTTGFASWYATLWTEEPLTLRAFFSLLSAQQFFNVSEKDTLEKLLEESAANQQEVTDQLGYQVRNAVEVLVQAIDNIDQDRNGRLLEGVDQKVLYEAALTYMMRLVFLFCAEERRLFPIDNELYAIHYAASTLREQLSKTASEHGEEILERRWDAWSRMLATFRLIFGGCDHPELRMPAYAGHLFDPDRFPFLEGRKPGTKWTNCEAEPLPIHNRTVLHLLEALQLLRVKVPGSSERQARRLSFRALDIEQIGHVYEGLLDHTAKRASEPMLGLAGGRDKEPEVPLSVLEDLRSQGENKLVEFLRDETGRSESALRKALAEEPDMLDAGRLRSVCSNDDKLIGRVQRFAGLIRRDTYDYPVVIRTGSVFVTAGTNRRSSGTHYTPKSLTEPVVQYTLEPLAFVGPAEGKPKEEWKLRTPKELLELKICDLACGSGAFLVQGCRYLSEALVKSWEIAERNHPAPNPGKLPFPTIMAEGKPSSGAPGETLIPKDAEERTAYAQRLIAHRCLYGVDINPLAVEMAKLSLWLLTMAKDKPFTFLDHAIRCGDSLLGIHDLNQLKTFSLDGTGHQYVFGEVPLDKLVDETVEMRLKIELMPGNTVDDVEVQAQIMADCEQRVEFLKCSADMLIAAELQGETPRDKLGSRDHAAVRIGHYLKEGTIDEFRAAASTELGRRSFQWPLEFPEIVTRRGGFDAFVGNPPFMGGKKITGNLGTAYRDYLVAHLAGDQRGNADLCAYFFLRAASLLRQDGQLGLLATNTIAQGETREVGLDQLAADGCVIPRAVPSRPWPGAATLEVAYIWIRRGTWNGQYELDGRSVAGISSSLAPSNENHGKPTNLAANASRAFLGSNLRGLGFVLTPDEAAQLIKRNPRNRDVLFPYINGQDVNSRSDQSPSRWVINFFDWDRDRAESYPDVIAILREKVLPERMQIKHEGTRRKGTDFFWRYDAQAKELYATIAGMNRVLARSRIANMHAVVWLPVGYVFNEKIVVFAHCSFPVMQSSIHEVWAREFSSTLRTDMQYTPSDCFETFPFPVACQRCEAIGTEYHEVRRQLMLSTERGLTKTYNRFHDAGETAVEVQRLRDLHVAMDNAVAAAYGWNDLDLGQSFHQTKQGIRFTISELARREVLSRLLKLNHERYAEEVARGLHDKGSGKVKKLPKPKKTTDEEEPNLFGTAASNNDGHDDGTAESEIETKVEEAGTDNRERATAIDEVDSDQAMAAFRQACRGTGWISRDEALKAVSERLGYQRLGPKIKDRLKGHLRAALRRLVLETEGDMVRIATPTMNTYWEQHRDQFIDHLLSVMRPGQRYERDEVIQTLASRLGFERVRETVEEPIRSAMNGAIRRGAIQSEGDTIWRK